MKVLAVQAGATAAAVCLLAFLMLKQEWSAQTARIGVTAAWGMISFLGGLLAGMGEKKEKNFCGERPAAACMFWFFSSSPWQEGGGRPCSRTGWPSAWLSAPAPAWREGCARGYAE